MWQLQSWVFSAKFFCTLTGASGTIDNIEVIHIPLDHMPEQYLSSYFLLFVEYMMTNMTIHTS